MGVHLIDAPFSSLLITVTAQTWTEWPQEFRLLISILMNSKFKTRSPWFQQPSKQLGLLYVTFIFWLLWFTDITTVNNRTIIPTPKSSHHVMSTALHLLFLVFCLSGQSLLLVLARSYFRNTTHLLCVYCALCVKLAEHYHHIIGNYHTLLTIIQDKLPVDYGG